MIIHPPRDRDDDYGPMGTTIPEYSPITALLDVRAAMLRAGIVIDVDQVQVDEAAGHMARALKAMGVRAAGWR